MHHPLSQSSLSFSQFWPGDGVHEFHRPFQPLSRFIIIHNHDWRLSCICKKFVMYQIRNTCIPDSIADSRGKWSALSRQALRYCRLAIHRQSLRLRGGSAAAASKCRGVRRSGTSTGVRLAANDDHSKCWDRRMSLPIISKTRSPGADLTYDRQSPRRTVGGVLSTIGSHNYG